MGLFRFLRKSKPSPISMSERQTRPRTVHVVRRNEGRYDAAQTTNNNSRHWAAADSLSADKANNAYAEGIVGTYAFHVVGHHGPRLQLLTEKPALNQAVEAEWLRWCVKARFGKKLRTLHRARVGDGEGFALFTTNKRLKHPVKLDLRVLECDRFHSPGLMSGTNNIDGVILDEHSNPVRYQVLDAHPGGSTYALPSDYREYDAEWVIHWFGQWRAEQHRGVPEIMSALPLFAILRRWTLATITAAETAADFAAVLQTDAPPDGEAADIEAFDAVEIERNMMLTMPAGWKLGQMESTQPPSTYGEVKREILSEIARPIAMPINIASGDSSKHNFASGKLDHGTYFMAVGILQGDMGDEVVDPTFFRWLREARVEFKWSLDDEPKHEWLWPGRAPIDPREAKAETERLGSGATTLPNIYAAQGKDWRVEMERGAEALGVSLEELQALIRKKLFKGKGDGQAATAEDIDEVTATLEDLIHATQG